ncbi:heparinase II/III-family protein [Vibrio sp. Of7-15]|uniref:heparinase II/III-family protein n=1 Tax=Vibrio sp. Of7-15 TaxID=2724879 RepID=UPI001EF30F62|nr:heparinase II/III-family protein [Vibrio sp. Of7-15]MCG7495343.1 heparinase II/III-family protein [Vibrio sp. Of7-15]
MFLKRSYFIFSGLSAHFGLALFLILFAKHFDLTVNQLAFRAMDKLNIDNPYVDYFLVPESDLGFNLSTDTIPVMKKSSPLFLPQINDLSNNRITPIRFDTSQLKKYLFCKKADLLWMTSCSLVYNDPKFLQLAKDRILNFGLVLPNSSGHYANGWQLAFAYDALKNNISFTEDEKRKVNTLLRKAIKHYLLLLNSDDPSQWHGRSTLASQMWLVVMALDHASSEELVQTVPHLYALVNASSMTEAWPEGYNYWINSRAIYVVLALAAYLNGTEPDIWHQKIKQLLERIGYWHIYATRPDMRIEPLGDEGPRLDLKDETRRVIDIIAQITQNPVFHQYSQSLEKLHGRESYFSNYRWGWPLFNSVNFISLAIAKNPADTDYLLPHFATFGEKHFGQSYIRQSWDSDSTFISYRSGDMFTHHGHYDNGHLSLFKGAPLLVNSSQYGKYSGDNRLNYAIRSVAKNTILVQNPNEQVKIGFNRNNDVNDGGQRVTMPLGSAILSPNDWFSKQTKSPVLAGGEIVARFSDESVVYLKSDLTRSYNSSWYDNNGDGGKVSTVTREILYLLSQDVLLVQDHIVTTKPEYKVKVIYHTVNKPIVDAESVLKGDQNNGILVTEEDVVKTKNGTGRLITEIFGKYDDVYLIGGDDYKFYVESDGDDTTLNGDNFSGGLSKKKIKRAPSWRFEINLPTNKNTHRITTVHRPSLEKYRIDRTQEHIFTNNQKLRQFGSLGVILSSDPDIQNMEWPSGVSELLVCNAEIKSACQWHDRKGEL